MKWNKMQRRMFSFVNLNWRGKPLVSDEDIVNLIDSRHTPSGRTIRDALDTTTYSTGAKVSEDVSNQFAQSLVSRRMELLH